MKHLNFKRINPKIACVDGTTLSVQGSRTHYSAQRRDIGLYYLVEVGFITDSKRETVTPPDTWREYTDGDAFPNDVYGYIPVELVEEFIAAHGGIKQGVMP